ncbi:hypothetical protein [Flavobacterium dankookense]|uniref:Uncharacterized protein n=1 Tax=Flavobacterium dankookense TaxID=706186 RepID=A0A4R6QEM0_9FLAO|nr:hypothetical protein [Flavobacterium dankookense]TDP61168.1 hypothetical protein BC748_0782 [Flavobacterium dankookense]
MSITKKKLKINVFGELWTLKKVVLTPIEMEYYSSIASRMNQPLHQALLDPFFYPKLRLESTTSFLDLRGNVISGVTENSSNQIDLWFDGKKEKIWVANLKNATLFPIYNITFSENLNVLSSGIYIETLEVGKIASCEVMLDDFSKERLEFNFIKHKELLLLENRFKYNGKNLKSNKTDSNFIRIHSFEI